MPHNTTATVYFFTADAHPVVRCTKHGLLPGFDPVPQRVLADPSPPPPPPPPPPVPTVQAEPEQPPQEVLADPSPPPAV